MMDDDKLLTREEVLWIEDALVAKDKRIAELEAILRGELVEMDEAQSIEYLRGYAHGMANQR